MRNKDTVEGIPAKEHKKTEKGNQRLGLLMVIVGFLWLTFSILGSFASYQHAAWILKSQSLPAEDLIPREEAVLAMRELGLDLKNRQRLTLVPASLMLMGGLLIFGIGPSRKTKNEGS